MTCWDNNKDDTCSSNYLILGDGDFSYSLDLCRYLSLLAVSSSSSSNQPNEQKRVSYRIVCTGMDTIDQLNSKYRDSNFILREILSLNNNHNSIRVLEGEPKRKKISRLQLLRDCRISPPTSQTLSTHPWNDTLHISIHHGVNAIIPWDDEPSFTTTDSSPPLPPDIRYRYIIFNYPHLGKEDAQLHSRFLAHLFHSVFYYWLAHPQERMNQKMEFNNSSYFYGTFHLTLVKGQCERWNCLQAAQNQGLILLHRGCFYIPPLHSSPTTPTASTTTTTSNNYPFTNQYQLRRNHSGQSFNKQILKDGGGNETFIFGRQHEWSTHHHHHHENTSSSTIPIEKNNIHDTYFLPWENPSSSSSSSPLEQQLSSLSTKRISCSMCGKMFQDERARKTHFKVVHDTDTSSVITAPPPPTTTTSTNGNIKQQFICTSCPNHRFFTNEKALKDHTIAKHQGLYTNIKPEWACTNQKQLVGETLLVNMIEKDGSSIQDIPQRCKVCLYPFRNQLDQQNHILELLPIQDMMYHTTLTSTVQSYSCTQCNKSFRDQRSQYQHENFCRQIKST